MQWRTIGGLALDCQCTLPGHPVIEDFVRHFSDPQICALPMYLLPPDVQRCTL